MISYSRVLQHTRPVEKKTTKSVTCKVKDDNLQFVDVLCSFISYVCKQNLISSTAHTVRTVHTRKVGLTAFDTKRWLCEDTVHNHSHGHKDTVSDLFTKSSFVDSFTNVGIYIRNNLPGTAPLAEDLI